MVLQLHLPYSHQMILQDDIQHVIYALNSDYITGGGYVKLFEKRVAEYVEAKYAVSFNSGTAAIHAALFAIGIERNDKVIIPAMTYIATSNAVCYLGGIPIFIDINTFDNYNLSIFQIGTHLLPETKAVIPVDYAGVPVDIKMIRKLYPQLKIIEDASHALGATRYGKPVGTDADITTFSFHPVKTITTGEGGMAVTDNIDWYKKMLLFRQNGVDREINYPNEPWRHDQVALGYNYKLSDINCALGCSQMNHIEDFLSDRLKIATYYDLALKEIVATPARDNTFDYTSSNHLYPILVKDRKMMYNNLAEKGIYCQVHYFPVPLQPYYRDTFGYKKGMFPAAEWFYEHELSIPIYPGLLMSEAEEVVRVIMEVLHC